MVEWALETRRAHWLMMAASAMPTAAHHAYLLAEAYNDAMVRVSPGLPEIPHEQPSIRGESTLA